MRSALRTFAADVEQHLAGRCAAERDSAVTERLHVDWTRCQARGLCLELVPELLAADDWGYPLSRTDDAAPVVPPRLAEHAERAVAECPRLALRLRPDPRANLRPALTTRGRGPTAALPADT